VDGTVVVLGEVQGDRVEQVKGVTYSVRQFLGEDNALLTKPEDEKTGEPECVLGDDTEKRREHDTVFADLAHTPAASPARKIPTKGKLYHLVLYLAPGDYHRFHSPANF